MDITTIMILLLLGVPIFLAIGGMFNPKPTTKSNRCNYGPFG
jgi:hypothetical protein